MESDREKAAAIIRKVKDLANEIVDRIKGDVVDALRSAGLTDEAVALDRKTTVLT